LTPDASCPGSVDGYTDAQAVFALPDKLLDCFVTVIGKRSVRRSRHKNQKRNCFVRHLFLLYFRLKGERTNAGSTCTFTFAGVRLFGFLPLFLLSCPLFSRLLPPPAFLFFFTPRFLPPAGRLLALLLTVVLRLTVAGSCPLSPVVRVALLISFRFRRNRTSNCECKRDCKYPRAYFFVCHVFLPFGAEYCPPLLF
jgi:hypothetical protein